MEPGDAPLTWLDWGTDAFGRAHLGRRLILLSLVTRWSEASERLDAETFGDRAVRRRIAEAAVPVRVDADERPDLAERYTLGGWPTTALLTPGGAVVSGGTFIGPGRLVAAIDRAASLMEAEGRALESRAEAPRWPAQPAVDGDSEIDRTSVECFRAVLGGAYDADHGGFGTTPKLPHARALRGGLAIAARGEDPELTEMLSRTLDAIGWRELSDESTGAFFRSSAAVDWSRPDRVRLAEVNADLLDVYVDAAEILGQTRYRARAADVAAFLVDELRDETGAIGASLVDRPDGETSRDTRLFVDANARVAAALVRAAGAVEEQRLFDAAIGIVERIVPEAYRQGAGVAHLLDPRPRVRGLLVDQVQVARALVAIAAETGTVAYWDLAEELMRGAIAKLWDRRRRAFVDRVTTTAGAGDAGLLACPFASLAVNCDAVHVLRALATRTGDATFLSRADDILRAFAPVWQEAGLEGGSYVAAVLSVGAEAVC